jgi:arsenite-transporting ATPase
MRVILFTGKGGVGKTTIAASTAVRAARAGLRTLIMSTDPAHSLADAFEVEIGDAPSEIVEHLWAQQIDAQTRLEDNWRDIQDYMVQVMNWAGTESIQAEELTVIPGIDEIFALIDVKTHVESKAYDVVIVDCAPTAETLRLLSLPDIMTWYIERIFPVQRRVVRAVRPIMSRTTNIPIAGDKVFEAIERLHRNLEAVRNILGDEEMSSVRLVVNPEKMVIAEARRTYTYLGLFGYRVDAVIVNRILPVDVTDPYFGKWKSIQAEHLATVHESFEPVPILEVRLFDREMVGVGLLAEMAEEVYDDRDATSVLFHDDPISVRKDGDGYILQLRLPFVTGGDLDVHRRTDELVVRVGPYKRNLLLPQILKRMVVRGANLVEDRLEISFEPEPATEGSE